MSMLSDANVRGLVALIYTLSGYIELCMYPSAYLHIFYCLWTNMWCSIYRTFYKIYNTYRHEYTINNYVEVLI